jgi:hypothetical protein
VKPQYCSACAPVAEAAASGMAAAAAARASIQHRIV